MSKSLRRLKQFIEDAGVEAEIIDIGPSHTAPLAAEQIGCDVDQIGKSILFANEDASKLWLFVTAGGSSVDVDAASALAESSLTKADANLVRAVTGFVIGGVAPFAHKNPVTCFYDPKLFHYEKIWHGGGTPNHVIGLDPELSRSLANGTIAEFTK